MNNIEAKLLGQTIRELTLKHPTMPPREIAKRTKANIKYVYNVRAVMKAKAKAAPEQASLPLSEPKVTAVIQVGDQLYTLDAHTKRIPLTDDEIQRVFLDHGRDGFGFIQFARAIEKAHGIL